MILIDFDSNGPCNRSQVLYTDYRYDILKMTMTWENKREQNFNVNIYNKKNYNFNVSPTSINSNVQLNTDILVTAGCHDNHMMK